MKKLFVRFVREDEGQDLIEYALLGGIITAVGATLIGTIGTRVGQLMTDLSAAIAAP